MKDLKLTPGPDLERLFRILLPSEQYGEDANAEEMYNRCCDMYALLKEAKEAIAKIIEPHVLSRLYSKGVPPFLPNGFDQCEEVLSKINKLFED